MWSSPIALLVPYARHGPGVWGAPSYDAEGPRVRRDIRSACFI